MRNCILAICVIVSFSVFVYSDESPAPDAKTRNVNEAVFEYAAAKRQLGPQHPKLVQLKTDIATRTLDGERLDFPDLDARLTRCYREYQTKKEKLSLRHPETQLTLDELSITTKLLSYESEYFSKNWERLLSQ